MSINWQSVEVLASQHVEEFIEGADLSRLEHLTTEEMFYLWKLLQWENHPGRKPDLLMLVQKKRAQDWLKGDRPFHGLAFKLFEKYWQEEFFEFLACGVN